MAGETNNSAEQGPSGPSTTTDDVVDLFVDTNMEEDFQLTSSAEAKTTEEKGKGESKQEEHLNNSAVSPGAKPRIPVLAVRPKKPAVANLVNNLRENVQSLPNPANPFEVLVGGLTYWTTTEALHNALSSAGAIDADIRGWWENSKNGQSLGVAVVSLSLSIPLRQFMSNLEGVSINGARPEVFPHTATFIQNCMTRYSPNDNFRPLDVHRDLNGPFSHPIYRSRGGAREQKLPVSPCRWNNAPAANNTGNFVPPRPPVGSRTDMVIPWQNGGRPAAPPPRLFGPTFPAGLGGRPPFHPPREPQPHQNFPMRNDTPFAPWGSQPPMGPCRLAGPPQLPNMTPRIGNNTAVQWRNGGPVLLPQPPPYQTMQMGQGRQPNPHWNPHVIRFMNNPNVQPRPRGPFPPNGMNMAQGPPPLQQHCRPPAPFASHLQPASPGVPTEGPGHTRTSDWNRKNESLPGALDNFSSVGEEIRRIEEVLGLAMKSAEREASEGNYADAIMTLTTARSIARHSKVAKERPCVNMMDRLEDTLAEVEHEAYGRKRGRRSDEQSPYSSREETRRRKRSQSRSRSPARDRYYRPCTSRRGLSPSPPRKRDGSVYRYRN